MRFLISEKLGPHKYKTPEGYLVCVDAILSRTGTQEYKRRELFGDACDDPDKIVKVDRKAEEVFSDKTMASFENKAICIEHPNASVNAENHNDLSVGFVRDIHRGEDNGTPVMMGTLVITDKKAVEAVESGEYKELSCGYDCDIKDEHSPQQRNIRGNHVALCKQGRAGIARIVDSRNYIYDAYTDFEYGYRDGKAGTYDKWYRYNRKDEGKEYDMGIQKAIREGYEIKNFIKGTGDSMKVDSQFVDMTRSTEKMVEQEYDKLIAERNEIDAEIDRNDNNARYDLYRASEKLQKLNKEILSMKKRFPFLQDAEIEKSHVFTRQEALRKIREIIESKIYTHEDSEGVIYLTKYAIELIKGMARSAKLTQNDLETLDRSLFGRYGYKIIDSMKDKLLTEDGYNELQQQVKQLTEKLNIKTSLGISINEKTKAVMLFAYNVKQAERWVDKLKASGYKAELHRESGNVNVAKFIMTELKTDSTLDAAQMQDTFTVEYVKDNITHIVEIEATSLEDAILKAKDEYVKDNKFIGEGIVTQVYGDRFGHKFDVSVAGKVYKFVTQNNIASTGAASKNDKVKVYQTDGGSIVFVLK